ncbi:hypothetical protein BP5796_03816 [Coleophoma crateriformis]|uniref:Uncharacterized protein n=1 Tax=Coleophoma crateriformis TaxID=565419 RepID=A0A3D8SH39_9HELO|nr:hypothetical protein BP5796_03816 [Coleophoma crateriformis]
MADSSGLPTAGQSADPISTSVPSSNPSTSDTIHEPIQAAAITPASNIAAAPTPTNEKKPHITLSTTDRSNTSSNPEDPYSLARYKREALDKRSLKADYPKGKPRPIKKFYNRQNELIESYLQSADEEAMEVEDQAENGPKVKFAQRGSFVVNVCLFIIQLYAAVSTKSLSLFATAADAFMDVVSSTIMLITTRMAARPNIVKYPVGRRRMEIMGIILFCAVMTLLAVELIIESARTLASGPKETEKLQIIPLVFVGVAIGSKSIMFVYCFLLRRYPGARIFMIDHRNDIVVNIFGLIMSIVGQRLVYWVDPAGAICIATLILYSWVSTAFEHVPMLVGESAPTDFINKCVYLAVTHDDRITKVDTVRAYHAGQHYYVEMDIIMDEETPLKVSHDVSQNLQRKLEGFSDVERAFVHVDYEGNHSVMEEHKPPYEIKAPKQPLFNRLKFWKTGRDAPQIENAPPTGILAQA